MIAVVLRAITPGESLPPVCCGVRRERGLATGPMDY